MSESSKIPPPYPQIPHLPHNPNLSFGDVVATNDTTRVLWTNSVFVQEKIDGSALAVAIVDGHPVLRNRDKFIKKGEQRKSAAATQFKSAWNWFYENIDKFKALEGYSVYGEWLVAQHGLPYNALTDWFMVYDLLDQQICQFVDTALAMKKAKDAGLSTLDPIYTGELDGYDSLVELAQGESPYATGHKREGVVVKVSDGKFTTHIFKMVRSDFQQGALWNPEKITKNKRGQ
jgi:hypothetical protein